MRVLRRAVLSTLPLRRSPGRGPEWWLHDAVRWWCSWGLLAQLTPSAVPTGFQNEIWLTGLPRAHRRSRSCPTAGCSWPSAEDGFASRRPAAVSCCPTRCHDRRHRHRRAMSAASTVWRCIRSSPPTRTSTCSTPRRHRLRDRVSRFTVTGNTASLASELVIWQDDVSPGLYHHGGTVAFGPDGLLYISTGDHLEPADSQSLTSYHGKILRVGADRRRPGRQSVQRRRRTEPRCNLGARLAQPVPVLLRFPDRDNVHRRTSAATSRRRRSKRSTSARAGANYGWPICEGSCAVAGMTNPVFSYPHAGRDASIIGGFVYRGTVFPPAYHGSYFFADYAQNWIRRLTLSAPGVVSGVVNFEPTNGAADGPYGDIVDLDEGPDGALYCVDIGPFGGVCRRQRAAHPLHARQRAARSSSATADPLVGPAPLTVAFSSAGSSDPEGASLTYAWDFGDGQASTAPNPSHVYAVNGAYTVRLTVSDGQQQTSSTPLTIRVGRPPVVTLTSPTNGATFRAGATIQVAGTADGPGRRAASAGVAVVDRRLPSRDPSASVPRADRGWQRQLRRAVEWPRVRWQHALSGDRHGHRRRWPVDVGRRCSSGRRRSPSPSTRRQPGWNSR